MRTTTYHLLRGFSAITLMWSGTIALADQSSLGVGDAMLVQAAADAPDRFSFTTLVDIEAGTLINFADNSRANSSTGYSGWRFGADGSFPEGSYAWVAPTNIAAGSVVSLVDTNHNLGFATAGDTILAFQGTIYRPQFIGGVGWSSGDAFITTGTADSNTSYLPSSLILGSSATELGNLDNFVYTGTTTGTRAGLQTAIAMTSNWTGNDTTVAPVPGALTVTDATAAPDATTVIGGYQFGVSAATYTLNPTAETADLDMGALSFVNLTGTPDATGGNGLNSQDVSITNGWATAATADPLTQQGLQFTVTVGAGKALDISYLSFGAQKVTATGPGSVNVYISTDNFASSTQYGTTLALTGTNWGVFDFTDMAATQYTGTVSFRIVPFNGTSGAVQMEFDEIWLGGVLSVPEAPAWAFGALVCLAVCGRRVWGRYRMGADR